MSASKEKALADAHAAPVEERIYFISPAPSGLQSEWELCERHLEAVIETFYSIAERLEAKDRHAEAGIVRQRAIPQAQALRSLAAVLSEEGQNSRGP